jgi:REP element-mobilizing transposase RayT
MALAYFITFTTYGTWLSGSAKGSVDGEHNVYGTPLAESDAGREQQAHEAMTQPAYVLSAAERRIVCKAIVGLARDRGWDLLAVHVRSNHVHVVVFAERDPGRLMSDLKGRASRDLALAGFDDAARRRWTRHVRRSLCLTRLATGREPGQGGTALRCEYFLQHASPDSHVSLLT